MEVPKMTLIPQTLKMSCWYASAQMLIQWKMNKMQQSLPNLVPPELDAECRKIRDGNKGLTNGAILSLANRLGLVAVPPMSPSPEAIQRWLTTYGPLWVNGKTHIVVMAGIRNMEVKIYDPGPINVGKVEWRSLLDWYLGTSASSRDSSKEAQTVLMYCP